MNKKMELDIINFHRAEIDVGSRSLFVAIGQNLSNVKEFGVYAEDLQDICKGNLDSNSLAKHRHYNYRKSEEEIAKALKGNHRQDFLFGLKQEFESYRFYQKKIAACNKKIDRFLKKYINRDPVKKTQDQGKTL